MKNTEENNNNKLVLLFEDEEALRRSISFTLKRLGFMVVTCETVEGIVNTINSTVATGQQVVLVITDLQRPGSNGYELIKNVMRIDNSIPILAIIGHCSREVRSELTGLGVYSVLEKPFCVQELIENIQLLIKN